MGRSHPRECTVRPPAPTGTAPSLARRGRPRHGRGPAARRGRGTRGGRRDAQGGPEGGHRRRARRLVRRPLQGRRRCAREGRSGVHPERRAHQDAEGDVADRQGGRAGRGDLRLSRAWQRLALAVPRCPVAVHPERTGAGSDDRRGRHGPRLLRREPGRLGHPPRAERGRAAVPPVLRLGQHRARAADRDPGRQGGTSRQLRRRVLRGRGPGRHRGRLPPERDLYPPTVHRHDRDERPVPRRPELSRPRHRVRLVSDDRRPDRDGSDQRGQWPLLPLDRVRPGADRGPGHPDGVPADRHGPRRPGRSGRGDHGRHRGPVDRSAPDRGCRRAGPRRPTPHPVRGAGPGRRVAGRRGPDARRCGDGLRPGRRAPARRQHAGQAVRRGPARSPDRPERRLRVRYVPRHRPRLRAARRDDHDPERRRRHGQDADGVGRLVRVRLGPPRDRRRGRARRPLHVVVPGDRAVGQQRRPVHPIRGVRSGCDRPGDDRDRLGHAPSHRLVHRHRDRQARRPRRRQRDAGDVLPARRGCEDPLHDADRDRPFG